MRIIDASARSWDAAAAGFRWNVPEYFNIAHAVCEKHTDRRNRIALYYENERGDKATYTFGDIKRLSDRFANALRGLHIERGDRVAIILSQRPETAIAHMAIYKIGAIALPLSILFGSDAIEYRLRDSSAKLVITDRTHRDRVGSLIADIPELNTVIDCDAEDAAGFWGLLDRGSESAHVVDTRADDPALLIYTSGTTGPPKGALVAHRCLYGNLTGFELSHNLFPQPDDVFWTPADWAWTGGLIDGLLPSWYYGVPIVGYEGGKFDPEFACDLMSRYQVRNAFIPPTALKMIRQVDRIRERYEVRLRSVMSAGETLGAELYQWGRDVLDLEINEMWGQSEANYLVGNCSALMEVQPGSMGKAYPGHRVEPVDSEGQVLADGEVGELAAYRPGDPVLFLGYWNNDAATKAKYLGEWWGTGDMGYRDDRGYVWFVGRKDDVISSAGYRIGPGEIEDCLLKHPAIAQAAVIGVPDSLRGEIVKAFIVLKTEASPSDELKAQIQASVRNRLAAYEYPRAIEFIDEMPLTTTGKVRRIELRDRETP